jgi:hypothetical protein
LARQIPLCKSDWYDKVRTQYGVSVCLPEVTYVLSVPVRLFMLLVQSVYR